ncbi:hypothetical protein [Ammoniphilus sp. CFH 90114]|uniref:hypothetical protein n=1 Tax=Ammoniphilus sp. CFH 90114 TaxID=2493665 RepID=UPI00100FBB40|nr:hypothetical protein [Ammoniphilus sp. CFH 90114]RXT08095.1 hypothetical protein EIZ39_11840 [Ammoniphilus sp. CFH 90114]
MSQEQLNKLKIAIEKGKELRTRALSRKEILEQQEKELLEEIRKMGVDPDRMEEEIAKLEAEKERLLKEIEGLIPFDLIK